MLEYTRNMLWKGWLFSNTPLQGIALTPSLPNKCPLNACSLKLLLSSFLSTLLSSLSWPGGPLRQVLPEQLLSMRSNIHNIVYEMCIRMKAKVSFNQLLALFQFQINFQYLHVIRQWQSETWSHTDPASSSALQSHMSAEARNSFKEVSGGPLYCKLTTRHHILRYYVSSNQ